MKIVFMGTPTFSVGILDAILKVGHQVVGVVTVADKPAGRGMKLNQSAIKTYCLEKNLTVLQPINLKDEVFIDELKQLDADLFIVVAFRMLPKVVWSMPKLGTFNLHASLLPDYRGSAPINWSLMNGDKKTGLTTFFIDEKIDTGEMIQQVEIEISENENAGELHDRMIVEGGKLVNLTIDNIINGNVKTTKQIDGNQFRLAPKLTKENTQINWDLPVKEIHDFIRGLNPYPGAWTIWENSKSEKKLVKVFSTRIINLESNNVNGFIKIDKKLVFKNDFGELEILEFQIEGKKKMSSNEWLIGNKVEEWKLYR